MELTGCGEPHDRIDNADDMSKRLRCPRTSLAGTVKVGTANGGGSGVARSAELEAAAEAPDGPDGTVFRGTRFSHLAAAKTGRLYRASYFPGEWSIRTGALAMPATVYKQATGCLAVLLIR